MLELNQLYLMDCMDGMAQFPDKYFDLAIVDPPYGIRVGNIGVFGERIGGVKQKSGDRLFVKRTEFAVKEWDNTPADRNYFNELIRISINQVVWGVNYFAFHFGSGRIIWDKCNGETTFSDCEIAYSSLFNNVRLFPFMWSGMCQGKSFINGRIQQGNKKLNEKRIHPTQKPVQLYKWLLNNYATPGMKIIDTHVGSGSSIIAFLDFGCEWIGFEIDEDYHKAATKRIEIHKQQGRFNFETAK